jgi:hypothetical protein
LQDYIPQFVVGRYKVNLTGNTQDDKLDKDNQCCVQIYLTCTDR